MALQVKRKSVIRKTKRRELKPVLINQEYQAKEIPLEMVVSDAPKDEMVKLSGDEEAILNSDRFVKTSAMTLRKMAALGHQVESLGTLRIGNGVVLVTKSTLVEFVKQLKEDADEGGNLQNNAKIVATIGNTIARLAKEFRSQNDTSPHKAPRRRNSFAPGRTVTVEENKKVTVSEQ